MIIKIRTTNDMIPRADGEGDFWRIFADVSGLHYGKQPIPANPAPPIERDQVNRYHFVSDDGSTLGNKTVAGMLLTFYEDGQPVEMFTNHECYLMNDNGRTIEQLYI